MSEHRKPIIWHPGEGRRYHLGKDDQIEVLFKTDGAEVDDGTLLRNGRWNPAHLAWIPISTTSMTN